MTGSGVFRCTRAAAWRIAREFGLVDPGGYSPGYVMWFDLASGGGACRLAWAPTERDGRGGALLDGANDLGIAWVGAVGGYPHRDVSPAVADVFRSREHRELPERVAWRLANPAICGFPDYLTSLRGVDLYATE